jgi:hypothetical protein
MEIKVTKDGILVSAEIYLDAKDAWNMHRALGDAIHEYHELVGRDRFRAEMGCDAESEDKDV